MNIDAMHPFYSETKVWFSQTSELILHTSMYFSYFSKMWFNIISFKIGNNKVLITLKNHILFPSIFYLQAEIRIESNVI